jgi:hypothetical protein
MVYGRAAYALHGDMVFILTMALWRLLVDSLGYLISGATLHQGRTLSD